MFSWRYGLAVHSRQGWNGLRQCGGCLTGWPTKHRYADIRMPVFFCRRTGKKNPPVQPGGGQIGENVQFAVRTSRLPKIRRRKARFGQGTNMPPATNTKHLRRLPQPVTKVRSAFPLPLHRACGIPLPYNDSRLQAGCPAGFLRRHTGRPPPGHDAALGGIPRRCAALPVH